MMRLYDYWRSSAAYRVRIALNFKGLAYEQVAVDLRAGAPARARVPGAQPAGPGAGARGRRRRADPVAADPQLPRGALPGAARCCPRTRPAAPAHARIAVAIACEIHPLNNLRVLQYLEHELGLDEAAAPRLVSPLDRRGPRPARDHARQRRRGASASAMRRAWPTSAWCRRSTTPGATTAISSPTRRSAGSTSAAASSSASPAPRPSASPTR